MASTMYPIPSRQTLPKYLFELRQHRPYVKR